MENNLTKPITTRLTKTEAENMEQICLDKEITRSEFIRIAVRSSLNKTEKQADK